MTKVFKKIEQTVFWGNVAILAFFAQFWAQMNFPGKKAQSVFKYSNYLPSCQKSEKANMPLFLRMDGQTNGWTYTDRRTDRQP